MKVGLFIPCYIDQFYPKVGIATFQLLQKLNLEVEYPLDQTCCGQPLANAGFGADSKKTAAHFVDQFSSFDYIVAPSGSCVLHVHEHYDIIPQTEEVVKVRSRVYELSRFLNEIAGIESFKGRFPHKVGLHMSCHGLRGLRMASSSERVDKEFNQMKSLVEKVEGLTWVDLNRIDECCGFGGTFSVSEEVISVSMGNDRLEDHLEHGAEIITSADMSCLMHLEGLARRQQKPVKIMHFAELLNQLEI
jgi:L-lactate dehydrogenase complex protein LldE